MGELSVMDNAFDGMLEAMKSGNREELMRLSGQADEDTPKAGLSRLNINYETDTDDGHSLKKGTWKVYYDGEFVYADSVDFRPLVRTYEWSVWDQEEGKFSSRSVQAPSLDFQFQDTTGGNKCGRLTKSEEEQLGAEHPLTLASRLATCNQVFYAVLTMDGKTADGRDVKIENYPVVTYFKRSGFRPAREAIERLGKNTLMNEVVFELTTKRNKQGSVTYFTPVFTVKDNIKMDDAAMETMAMFLETVKASNANILEQHKEAIKAKANEEEVDLAADFPVMLAEVQVKNFLLAATRGEAVLSPSVVEEFAQDCREALEKQFNRNPEWRIRMSGLGRPLCQQIHGRDGKDEEMTYNALLRFLIGDLVECAVMAVLKGAGVKITEAQGACQLDVGGETVKGTLDLIIDDPVDGEKVWDVKSASPYSYTQKFAKGYDNIKDDDPFGYLMQGHLYAESKGKDFGGWIVVDKSSGEIQFVQAPDDQSDDREEYLEDAAKVVESLMTNFTYKKPPIPPEDEVYTAQGTKIHTGNKLLSKNCTFCGYRKHCWPNAVQHEKVTSKAKNKPVVWYHTLKVKEL